MRETVVADKLQCFISAPAGLSLDALCSSLISHGYVPIVRDNLVAVDSLTWSIKRAILKSSLVIGILSNEEQSAAVIFEIGQAFAFGRRIALIETSTEMAVPASLQHLLTLRIDLDNRQAIDFALDQIVAAPEKKRRPRQLKLFESEALGKQADTIQRKLELALEAKDYQAVEKMVADAIRRTGAEQVVQSAAGSVSADMAVWSEAFASILGNPLLVEIKTSVQSTQVANRVFGQIEKTIDESGARSALLLYADGPSLESEVWRGCPRNVLILPIRALIESLRERSFPALLRDLRNERAHSVRK
jgi:hypothetical protein